LRVFSFGGYGLALVALALVVFGAYDRYPTKYTLANLPLSLRMAIIVLCKIPDKIYDVMVSRHVRKAVSIFFCGKKARFREGVVIISIRTAGLV